MASYLRAGGRLASGEGEEEEERGRRKGRGGGSSSGGDGGSLHCFVKIREFNCYATSTAAERSKERGATAAGWR